MKTITIGEKIDDNLRSLIHSLDEVSIIENGKEIAMLSEDQINVIVSDFCDLQVETDLNCIENDLPLVKIDFVNYLIDTLGFCLVDNVVRVK